MKKNILLLMSAMILLGGCGGDKTSTSNNKSNNSTPKTSSSVVTNKYQITFIDENGNVLENKEWDEGSLPSYNYEVKDTEEWDYTFVGWSLEQGGEVVDVEKVTSEETYYAIVTKVKQQYTVTFNTLSDDVIDSITADYGTLIEEPTAPKKENYRFTGWVDSVTNETVNWPFTLTKDVTLNAEWNEYVDIKGFLSNLVEGVQISPYSYIPASLQPTNSDNHIINKDDVNYDFTNSTKVEDINYGGYGEQWNMVITNIEQSEVFYNVLFVAENIINASVLAFNNYLDKNPSTTANHNLNEQEYTAFLNYENGVLTYKLELKTTLNIPLIGQISPSIEMVYDVENNVKNTKIQLTEGNVIKYSVSENKYVFGLEYSLSEVSRKAYFEISINEDEEVAGHIYEFIQFKDQDTIGSCADFYINDSYASVVGNKADGMLGFKGYINELYSVDNGKLLVYEVKETLSIAGVSGEYHTLWFNLNDILGITSVKAIENENFGEYGKNNHDIYLNDSDKIFEPTKNSKFGIPTSRKYDVELRKQVFYGYEEEELVKYETNIPMMFIQADNENDTNYSDFTSDMLSKNKIVASVIIEDEVLDKVLLDHDTYIPIFIENKDNVTGNTIEEFLRA